MKVNFWIIEEGGSPEDAKRVVHTASVFQLAIASIITCIKSLGHGICYTILPAFYGIITVLPVVLIVLVITAIEEVFSVDIHLFTFFGIIAGLVMICISAWSFVLSFYSELASVCKKDAMIESFGHYSRKAEIVMPEDWDSWKSEWRKTHKRRSTFKEIDEFTPTEFAGDGTGGQSGEIFNETGEFTHAESYIFAGEGVGGHSGEVLARKAISIFENKFPHRIAHDPPVKITQSSDEKIIIALSYGVREGEAPLSVGQEFGKICRSLGL